MASRGVAVLTREDIAAYAPALAAIGLAAVALPVTAYAPPADPGAIARAFAEAEDSCDVMVASPRAAAAYAALPRAVRERQLEGRAIWAIGEATAAVLRDAAAEIDLEVVVPSPAPRDGRELAEAYVAVHLPSDRSRVIVLRAEGGRDAGITLLRLRHVDVIDVVAYRTVAVAPADRDPAALAALARPDAIACLFAPSQVAALGRADLARYAAIGRTTAAALAAAGVPADRIATAATPTPAGLAEAIQTVYLQSS